MSDPAVQPEVSGEEGRKVERRRLIQALIVEDDEDMLRLIEKVVHLRGHQATGCADAESAWTAYQQDQYSLVFLDWQLPGMDGLELCRRIRSHPNSEGTIIVMITARDHWEDLEAALRSGANDYLTKPVNLDTLKVRLAIAEQSVRNLDRRREAEEALRDQEETVLNLKRQLNEKSQFQDLIGKSKLMGDLYLRIRELAKVDTTVLIEGETGTGKELVARAVHFSSTRKAGPFIAINCAGLTDALLASQLFGHKKGAFTGAVDHQQGFFEAANGGTLFLDEIGDISSAVQISLLRVLQEKEIVRLGESRPRKVDVRVLAATHHNLSQDVVNGSFRADLLYRIRVARIQLPSLRDRRGDIPLLIASFLGQCCAVTGKLVDRVSPEALQALTNYAWPGNVRELKSAIEAGLISCKDNTIQIEDLPPEVLDSNSVPHMTLEAPQDEKTRLLAALGRAKGNRTMAARLLGVSRATLYRRLTDLNLTPE
ncbi:MAG: sigma-54 dependent transcriptional regulator [Nitrospirales bacterium]